MSLSSSSRFGAAALALSVVGLSLELCDFGVLWWTIDAHSLFHAATIPCPLLWAEFVIEDSRVFPAKID